MLFYNLKIVLRNISRYKQSYILNIFCLIVALMVCFITSFYVLYQNFYHKTEYTAENIYLVKETMNDWEDFGSEKISLGMSDYLTHEVPGIECVVKYNETGDFHIEVAPEKIFKEWNFHFVDSNYLKYKNIKITRGSSDLTVSSPRHLHNDRSWINIINFNSYQYLITINDHTLFTTPSSEPDHTYRR